jgi:heat shock protein HslJ
MPEQQTLVVGSRMKFTLSPVAFVGATSVALLMGCASELSRNSGQTTSMPVASNPDATMTLERSWALKALEGAAVSVPAERARPTLIFDAEKKRVTGMAAVNRFSGSYTLEGQRLKFGALLATKMAGPPELNALETSYLRALEQATGWRSAGEDLELLAENRVVARFSAQR